MEPHVSLITLGVPDVEKSPGRSCSCRSGGFADEPTASLVADNRRAVTRLLTDAAAHGACVVIATHDEELAAHADAAHTL